MTIKIQYNYKGLEQAMLTGSGIERVEREVMEQKLSEIQGQFIADFGFTGKFKIESGEAKPGKYGTTRTKFKIVAADVKTRAILKQHPGWLGKFID